jgi:SPP1 gp7 family putative phage head morphogenesis protein
MSIADIDIKFALKLPPREIIKYFLSKDLKISLDWQEVLEDAHKRSFTVAKVARMDILQDFKDEITKALKSGGTLQTFRKNLTPILKAKGWWGKQIMVDAEGNAKEVQLGNPYRLNNIYRTNLQTSYMAGRHKIQEETKKFFPYWQFIAVMDSRTRPSHAALHGKVFRSDDPFWDTHYPPLDWGCRCSVIARSERQLERKGLTVEDSRGNMVTDTVTVGENSLTGPRDVEISGLKTTGRNGEPVTVWTGPGWNYNPGKGAIAPDLGKYSPDIRSLYGK